MSTALAKASRLKPDIRLAQALSQFEADLPAERKAAFRTYKSQAHDSPPTQSDLIRLASEVNRLSSKDAVGGRCFAPRFINILQTVQQYAALGDIIIGGSQSLLACGLWSLVRTTLQLVASSTSYFEKVSALFMVIGRSAPRYQDMTLLYPRSQKLQSSLTEYFIVLVRLCHHILKFSQKSAVGQLVSSLDDSNLKTYQSQFDFWSNSIREEVQLLSYQKIEDGAKETTLFRKSLSKYFESDSRHRKSVTRLQILNSCSTYDHETTWKQIRKVGNTNLFKQSTDCQDWIEDPKANSTLMYIGKLGSGKSVLLANIVDFVNDNLPNKDSLVTYFFCRHDIQESLRARTVIGSLARQLLSPIKNLSDVALFNEDPPVLSFGQIISQLHVGMKDVNQPITAYFILDGLDECEVKEAVEIKRQIRQIQNILDLRLCVSSRSDVGNASKLKDIFATNRVFTMERNTDIPLYIDAELEKCLESGKLMLGDPSLILEIKDALLKGAQGMFLWVSIQIEALCIEKTDAAMRRSLADLPKDLSEIFTRVLKRLGNTGENYRSRILELILAAHRPLTVEELGEALSVVPGDTTWNPERLINDVYSTLALCGSLISVDEEELTVRLIHHSVKQFLLTYPEGSNVLEHSQHGHFTAQNANFKLANIILTYLNYGIFDNHLAARTPERFVELNPSTVITSTLNPKSTVQSIAIKLLRAKNPWNETNKITLHARPHSPYRAVDEFQFLHYAKTFWLDHLSSCYLDFPVADSPIYKLLVKLVKGNIVDINTQDRHGQTIFTLAVRYGDEALAKLLLNHPNIDLNLQNSDGRTALAEAQCAGYDSIVPLLLATGEVVQDSRD